MDAYEAPTLTEIGTLHENTLAGKVLGRSDGFTFQGANIGEVTDPVAS